MKVVGVIMCGILGISAGITTSYAQTTVDPDTGRTVPRDRSQTIDPDTGRTVPHDRTVVEDRGPRDRVVVEERVVERRREGEVYVGGFGGFTLGHSFSSIDGRGTLGGQEFESFDLANSVIYGAKIGYFHPGRLSWLGLEMEGFNTTPHFEQNAAFPGSNLRVTTLAFNVIARTRLGCRDHDRHNRDYDRTRQGTTRDGRTHYYEDHSTADDNAKCPIQVYAGAGPGIFFAETSNQFGRSTDNLEVGLNALAGMKYFVHRNVSIFGEYKFNYAGFDFSQLQGTTAGVEGNYKASHFVGGLAVHF
jgi:opacity protein-like surface antigen